MTSVFPYIQTDGFPHDLAVSSPAPFPAVFVATAGGSSIAPRQPSYSVTHGPAGTGAQAGHDPHAPRSRIAGLVSLCHRMASALRRRKGRADGAGKGVGHIIGRRAERLNNRNRAAADRYVTVHSILARGRA